MHTATKITEAEWFDNLKKFRRVVERHKGRTEYEPQAELLVRKFELEFIVYAEIQEVAQMEVEPELFCSAYESMNKAFWREGANNPFPLPVPEREYQMWGVKMVKKAAKKTGAVEGMMAI